MPLNNGQSTTTPTILSAFKALEDCINYNMNCVKVATIVEFDENTLTAKCRVNNKRLLNLKDNGNQILQDYPDIYAKVCFFGWGDIAITHPINVGMEGLLLFNDREIETWFLTGGPGELAYDRCHDLSDALFICGLHSQINIPLVQYLSDCLHLYYKTSDIKIGEESIESNTKEYTINAEDSIEENTKDYTINSDTSYTLNTTTQTVNANTRNITATTNHSGTLTATQLNDTTAATNTFTTSDGKIITVVNGIIRTIVG